MFKLSLLDKISIVLVLVGALNWGILGISNVNIVEEITSIFGDISSIIERIIYIFVGAAGLNIIVLIYKIRNRS